LEKRFKSLYYCRSKSIQRAENNNDAKSTDVTANVINLKINNQIRTRIRGVFIMSVAEKIKVEINSTKKNGIIS
jgi:adenine-specific DNA methylase